ncbi:MAG: thiamine pyrophosphate-dependent enzyme [Paracoccaceae bacterium]|nr:thiamine pyrophosphate-dependent enzyme [Paracoccaceae bacterium]
MPKALVIDPAVTRQRDSLAVPPIPVHAYDVPFADALTLHGAETLRDALRHMVLIREFESMLASFKATGAYRGVDYAYRGPAHLSIGQEGAAVGAALALAPEDYTFGSHRSHGEFLAKGLGAIARLPEAELDGIMARQDGGRLREAAETAVAGEGRALAETFLMLGFLAEIFMRATGFNGGMGGSMHAFFPPLGCYPNNAIVGASAGIATGAALRRRLAGEAGICVAHAGDGATGCGPVWEAMNFAAMGQLSTLWEAPFDGGLPVLFFFTNNFYAMGGQTSGETMGWDRLSRIGAGVAPNALHAETVDGTDVLAVADAVARKRALLVDRQGPALLDVECYRISGHSTTDANAYRSRDELKLWEAHDPIARLATSLIDAGALAEDGLAALEEEAGRRIEAVTRAAVDEALSPSVDIVAHPVLIGDLMFSGGETPVPDAPSTLTAPREASAALRKLARKSRAGRDADGAPLSPMRAITLRDGLTEAILDRMERDPRLAAWGEELREWGGAFGVTRGLSDVLPYHRLFNAPISEAAIVATAIGHAMAGGRSMVELMYADFIGRAGDEIFNQLAKWQAMSAGQLKLPVVLRASVGSKYGAQHSQDWSALIAHIPGLKVIYPATPYDAKGLMASALASDDPVVVFESQRLYDRVEQFRHAVPAESYTLPLGVPEVKREGRDVTVLTIGPSLYPALDAARDLAALGVAAEVIDARSLVPFDYAPVLASVARTGHLLVVSEASERGSMAQTLAATVTRHGFASLKAAPIVLGAPNWIVPGAEMETTYFPQAHDIVDAVTAEFYPDRKPNRRGVRDWDGLSLARRGL